MNAPANVLIIHVLIVVNCWPLTNILLLLIECNILDLFNSFLSLGMPIEFIHFGNYVFIGMQHGECLTTLSNNL